MEKLTEVLKNSKKAEMGLQSEIKTCPKCGEPLGRLVKMPFGEIVGPRACKCKRDKMAKEKIENEAKEKQIRLQRVIKNSLMNSKLRTWTFENWDHNKVNEKFFQLGTKYVEKFQEMKANNQGLLIHGDPGNGKTYLTAAIANELLKRYVPVICVGSIALTERIAESKRSYGDEGIFTVLNSLENADLLIIDDLGTEPDNRWTRSMIYQIIDKRDNSNLPLIVTTNISMDQLKDRYDDRTYSRLTQMCSFIRNTGKDLRQQEGKEKTQKFLQDLFK